ncbi:hypothetical protein [Kitasatospora griseola]
MDTVSRSGQLLQHPAGHDSDLREAVEEFRHGRVWSVRGLLHQSWGDWGLWTSRTQVLGAVAVHLNVLDIWEREEPDAFGLTTLRSRVAVEAALLAAQQPAAKQELGQYVESAREWCWQAASALAADPVPWLGLLALAQLDTELARPEHRVPAGDKLLPPGPWGLFDQVRRTDPWNREAFHRMLRFWLVRGAIGPASSFLSGYLRDAPAGSPLHALPLYLHVERYRRAEAGSEAAAYMQWTNDEQVRLTVQRVLAHWRAARGAGARWPVADESHLAHALSATRRHQDAAEVFTAMHPFVSGEPWASLSDDPNRLLHDSVRKAFAAR